MSTTPGEPRRNRHATPSPERTRGSSPDPLAPLIPVAWIAAAVLAFLYLPALAPARAAWPTSRPRTRRPIATEARSARIFGQPISRVAVVQRDPAGLSPAVQRQTVAAAVDLTQHPRDPLLGALPLLTTRACGPRRRPGDHGGDLPLLRARRRRGRSRCGWRARTRPARLTQPGASVVGRDGLRAGARRAGGRHRRAPQRRRDRDRDPRRARPGRHLRVGARAAGHAARRRRGLRDRLAARGARRARARARPALGDRPSGGGAPAGDRRRLRDLLPLGRQGAARPAATGADRPRATRRRSSRRSSSSPALMVAAGTAALLAATQATFRSFGPSLAISVLVGPRGQRHLRPRGDGHLRPGAVLAARSGRPRAAATPRRGPAGSTRAARPGRPISPRTAAAALGDRRRLRRGPRCVAASGLRWIGLGLDFISGLPASSEPRQAADGGRGGLRPGHPLADGGAPAEAGRRDAGRRSWPLWSRPSRAQPGVAAVLGPARAAARPAHPLRGVARPERGAVLRGVLHRPAREQRHRHARLAAGGDARARAAGRADRRARRLRGRHGDRRLHRGQDGRRSGPRRRRRDRHRRAPAGAVPAQPGGAAVPGRGQRPGAGRGARSHHVLLQAAAGTGGADVLRALCGVGAPGLAGQRLHHLRGGPHLGGAARAAPARRDRDGGAQGAERRLGGGDHARAQLRHAGDRQPLVVPPAGVPAGRRRADRRVLRALAAGAGPGRAVRAHVDREAAIERRRTSERTGGPPDATARTQPDRQEPDAARAA